MCNQINSSAPAKRTFLGLFAPPPQLFKIAGSSNTGSAPSAVVDKFFLAGVLALLIGVGWLGVHHWLILNGQIPADQNYLRNRSLHILIQFYSFFGLFIAGFLSQAGPRLLQVSVLATKRVLLVIPAVLVGITMRASFPDWALSSVMISLPFAVLLVAFVQLVRTAAEPQRVRFGVWILLSLLSFTLSPLIAVETTDGALIFFWFAVGSITLAAGQQFIAAFLGGVALNPVQGRLLLVSFLAAGCALYLQTLPGHIAGLLVCVVILFYIVKLQLYSSFFTVCRTALGFGFQTAYLWALFGAITLLIYGRSQADVVLHIWAIGWVSTLVITISSQVLRSISGGRYPLSDRAVLLLLVIWQFVPLGRAGTRLLPLPPSFSLVVAWAVTIVALVWVVAVIATVHRIYATKRRKQSVIEAEGRSLASTAHSCHSPASV